MGLGFRGVPANHEDQVALAVAVNMLNNANGTGFIHDRRDALANGFLSADALGITLNLALEFSKRVVNAPIFPIERKISDSMRDKIDKYLFRKCNK